MANTHELKGKLKEKIEQNQQMGLLSKQLATIMLDCPVSFDAENCEVKNPNFQKLNPILEELELNRASKMIQQIFEIPAEKPKPKSQVDKNEIPQLDLFSANSSQKSEQINPQTSPNQNYFYPIQNEIEHQLLLKYLQKAKKVAFTFVFQDAQVLEKCCGIGFSFHPKTAYFLPLNFQKKTQYSQKINTFKPFFENPNITKIGANLKKIYKTLTEENIHLKGELFDTSIAHYLIDSDTKYNFNRIVKVYLNQELAEISTKKPAFQNQNLQTKIEQILPQTLATLQLEPILKGKLKEQELEDLYFNLEIPLLKVLGTMEQNGIALDVPYLNQKSKEVQTELSQLQNEIFTLAGEEFNLASPKQMGVVLFEKLQLLQNPKKTKTGQYATGEEILNKLKHHKIVELILKWRGLEKLKTTYLDALPMEVSPETKRIHTTFMQTVTATGRLSSVKPNLQNIPIRTAKGQQIRKAFIAKNEDFVLLSADYSQIELRLIAVLSGENTMLKAFENKQDIHQMTASKLFKVPLEMVTKTQRTQAKAVNFGIIYGQGSSALSEQTSLDKKDAKALINAYYDTYPKLKAYMSNQVLLAREKGFAQTILGRKRILRHIDSQNGLVRSADERNAVNTPVQGSAADLIKKAMILIDEMLKTKNLNAQMLLQIHDELIFEVPKTELEEVQNIVKTQMENALDMPISLEVDMGVGQNWLQAH